MPLLQPWIVSHQLRDEKSLEGKLDVPVLLVVLLYTCVQKRAADFKFFDLNLVHSLIGFCSISTKQIRQQDEHFRRSARVQYCRAVDRRIYTACFEVGEIQN